MVHATLLLNFTHDQYHDSPLVVVDNLKSESEMFAGLLKSSGVVIDSMVSKKELREEISTLSTLSGEYRRHTRGGPSLADRYRQDDRTLLSDSLEVMPYCRAVGAVWQYVEVAPSKNSGLNRIQLNWRCIRTA